LRTSPLISFLNTPLSLKNEQLGVALQTASTELDLFIAGRTIAGLGIGIVSTIVPLYQSETAPRWIRGAVVSGYQWFITIGKLLTRARSIKFFSL